eukprot:2477871-Rhodomonas_salina.1
MTRMILSYAKDLGAWHLHQKKPPAPPAVQLVRLRLYMPVLFLYWWPGPPALYPAAPRRGCQIWVAFRQHWVFARNVPKCPSL